MNVLIIIFLIVTIIYELTMLGMLVYDIVREIIKKRKERAAEMTSDSIEDDLANEQMENEDSAENEDLAENEDQPIHED